MSDDEPMDQDESVTSKLGAFFGYRNPRKTSSSDEDTGATSSGRSGKDSQDPGKTSGPTGDTDDESGASEGEEGNGMPEIDVKLARLEPFFGEKAKDTVTAKAWAESVDYAMKVTNMNDERTAAYAAAYLKGEAAMWVQSLRERNDQSLQSWTNLKKKFLEWFHEKRTASQRQELQRSLKQRAAEPVRAFYNRVDIACLNLEEEWPAPEQGMNADKRAGFLRAKELLHDVMHRDYFLAGLRSEIRDVVLTSNPESLDAAFRKAIDVESSLKEKHGSKAVHELQVAAVEGNQSNSNAGDINHIVAAVVQAMKRGDQGAQSQPKDGDKKKKDGRECYYCGVAGHIEPKCFKKKEHAEKGIYEPVNKERSRPPKKKQEAAAVSVEAIRKQPKVAQPASPAWGQQQQQRQAGDIYGAIASGNDIWDN